MLGRALSELLVSRGIEVCVLVNPSSTRKDVILDDPLVTRLDCDLSGMAVLATVADDELPAALRGHIDAFFHLGWAGTSGAGRNDVAAQCANIGYTLDAVSLADRLGCEVFLGAGSQAEYGRVEGKLTPQTPAFPENAYGVAKLAAGRLSALACAQLGIRHVWTRILSVYGPWDGMQTMVLSAIDRLLSGEVPAFTPAEQQWDYLYCTDAARALLLAAEKGRDSAIYCIGSGQARQLADYIRAIRDAVDPDSQVAIGALDYGPSQVMYLCADITDLQRDTGFEVQVPFEQGIAETVEWMRERRDGKGRA